MDAPFSHVSMPSVTDVYTDVQGLQGLRLEKDEVALQKVAQQFESMFINMLLKNVRSANEVLGEGGLFDNNESKFYQDMHDNQMALNLSHGRGFGIAEAMYRQLSRSHGDGTGAVPTRGARGPSVSMEAKAASVEAQKIKKNGPIEVSDRSQIASSPMDFVERVYEHAKVAAEKIGVEAEVLIAQAALETGWGRYVFTNKRGESSFNVFNIKANSTWDGASVAKASLEFMGGNFSRVASTFRAYPSVKESFSDFSDFITGSERYKNAAENISNPLEFIRNIHRAGYATDPEYTDKISSVYSRVKSLLKSDELKSLVVGDNREL